MTRYTVAMTTEEKIQFEVSNFKLGWLNEQVEKLNKKAAKLGTKPISVQVLNTYQKDRVVGMKPALDGPIMTDHGPMKYIVVNETWNTIEVDGETPMLAGWQFVGTLEHLEAGTLLKKVPVFEGEVDLTAYRNSTPDNCDHCHQLRRRNFTYVVRNVETGELKQVGSSCLKDFLGHNSPETVAKWAETLSNWFLELASGEMSDDDMDYVGGGRSGRFGIDVVEYLAQVNAVINKYGWIPRWKAQDWDKTSTADDAWDLYLEKRPEYRLDPSDKDYEMAKKAIEWMQALEPKITEKSDYLWNLRVAAAEEIVYYSTKGLIASGIQAYRREVEKIIEQRKARENKSNEFVGEVGKREIFEVTVMNVFETESDFGVTFIYKMEDPAGNKLTWFSSNNILDQGHTYKLKATVKKHEDHPKYGKATIINRGAVEEDLGSSLPADKVAA